MSLPAITGRNRTSGALRVPYSLQCLQTGQKQTPGKAMPMLLLKSTREALQITNGFHHRQTARDGGIASGSSFH